MAISFNNNTARLYCKNDQAAQLLAKAVLAEETNLDEKAVDFLLEWYPEVIMTKNGYEGWAVIARPNLRLVTEADEIAEYEADNPDAIVIGQDAAYEGVIVWREY